MKNNELAEYVDVQRWLMNSGLFTGSAKNMLFTYGSIAHPEVKAVEVDVNVDDKLVSYKLYLPKTVLKKVEKYKKLSKSTSFWGLRSFKKFLQKEGDMNFKNILLGFVRDFCGPKWLVDVEILDIANYEEGYEDEESIKGTTDNRYIDNQ